MREALLERDGPRSFLFAGIGAWEPLTEDQQALSVEPDSGQLQVQAPLFIPSESRGGPGSRAYPQRVRCAKASAC